MGARDYPGIISRRRRWAVAILWAEILLGVLAPAGGILLAYLVLVLFGFGQPVLWAASLLLALLALGAGLWRVRPPAPAAVERRIEAASGLKHRPLAVLADAPETDNALALAMWQLHQARMLNALSRSRNFAPDLHAASRDPLALRGFLLLLLLSGFIAAGQNLPSRLATGFALPVWNFAGPEVNAWITPPDYAGLPPHLLVPGEQLSALAGSKLAVITGGLRHAPLIQLGGTHFTLSDLGQGSHRADAVLETSGRLRVGPWWHRLGIWNISVLQPVAPVINITGITLSPGSKMALSWHITDPYGLAGLQLAFHVPGHKNALPENFTLAPVLDGKTRLDLSESPFFGLPVSFSMTARNLAGVTGSLSPGGTYDLPGLNLQDKTALALNALRQQVALEPETTPVSGASLQALAAAPLSAITAAADVQIAVLGSAMVMRQITPRDAAERLLALVKETDAGPDFAASQALQRSNQALLSALQKGLNGQPPSDAQIQQLMQAMEQALAARMQNSPPPDKQAAGGQQMDMSALDKLAAQIGKDEAAGRTAQAAKELAQLKAALNALANAKPMTTQQEAQGRAADKAAQGLSQIMQGEAALLNSTQQGKGSPAQQGVLKSALDGIKQSLKGAKINLPGLGDASQAMGQAGDRLGQDDHPGAAGAEMAAIQALQKAAEALNAARQNSLSIGQSGSQMPDQQPFDTGVNGAPDESFLPGLDTPEANPAGIIQQRIMKRDSAPGLPAPTHEYLQRLLDPGNF
jgi:hypothetical protein